MRERAKRLHAEHRALRQPLVVRLECYLPLEERRKPPTEVNSGLTLRLRRSRSHTSGLGGLICFFRKCSRHKTINPAQITSGAPIHTDRFGISSKNT
jgi:hypothetical protein